MPNMGPKDLELSVPFEAENHIPLPAEKAYIDFQLASKNSKSGHFNILIAAIKREIADSYLFCLKRAGLKVQALEVESQSIVRSVIKAEESQKPVLIVDFGKSVASFIIFSGFSIRLTSSCSINSEDITNAIAKDLKLTCKEAEKLKRKYGLKKAKKPISQVLEKIAKEIKKYADYYQNHNKKKIAKIILCGRGSNLPGINQFFSSKLKINVETANLWVNILPESLKEVPGLSYEDSLGYTTALGLALRGAKK